MICRDFCMRPYFIFVRTYDSSCFLHGAQRQTTFARSAMGAKTTDAGSNSSSAESMLQPAGYNATRRAVLLTAASIVPLDPSSRIELGPVSYYYCCFLLGLLCTAVLSCCCVVLLLYTLAAGAAAKQQTYYAPGTRHYVLVQKIVLTSTLMYFRIMLRV